MTRRLAFAFGMGFVTTFWRGHLGFVWTVLLLVGTSIVLTRGVAFLGLALVPVLLGVSVWQSVGAWRYGERVLRDGALTRVYGVYAAAGVAVLSNVLVGIGAALPAPPVDLVVQGYAPKVSVEGPVARVSGEIDYQVLTELKAVEGVRVLVLDSTGGQVQAGRAIGLLATSEGWDTRVDAVCFSACTLAFVGGVKRELGPDAVLGFHGYRFVDPLQVQTVNKADVEDKDRAFLRAQGVTDQFVEQVFATSPQDLWQPTRAELVAAGVLK